jgi:hypothetical protein
MKCNAKAKSTGKQCTRDAMLGSTKCYVHGGATPKGIASPQFKTGRYSKHLPSSLLDIYNQATDDPDLLSVRQDITLLDTLIAAKLPLLEDWESREHWDTTLKLIIKARRAYRSEDYAGLEEALSELEAIADKRRLFFAAEGEIQSQVEQRRKLVETEQKILYNQTRSLTAEQAMILVSALLDSVRRNVMDGSALNAIQADFIRLIGATHQHELSG